MNGALLFGAGGAVLASIVCMMALGRADDVAPFAQRLTTGAADPSTGESSVPINGRADPNTPPGSRGAPAAIEYGSSRRNGLEKRIEVALAEYERARQTYRIYRTDSPEIEPEKRYALMTEALETCRVLRQELQGIAADDRAPSAVRARSGELAVALQVLVGDILKALPF